MKNILVVEDDPDFGELLRLHLEASGHQVRLESDGITGLDATRQQSFDLAILDLMLPGLDGREICRSIRADSHYFPIIMLTACGDESERVLGLEIGADDYLTKPCSMSELVARVRAIFRREAYLRDELPGHVHAPATPPSNPCLARSGIRMDVLKRTVFLENSQIHLTAREFDLLHQLAGNPGRVYSRKQLLDEVWGIDKDAYEHTVNAHINRLRGKIEREPTKPERIITVWGVGYKFAET
ncbi:MAG: response regulator transcription factor [Gammaproteobacteria bacterium]|nr:response regulator transcription factor [Gammaproteobacteria bacterium]